jgi:hypothetical protein
LRKFSIPCADVRSSPGGDSWRDSDINLKLQVRLRKSYNSYLSTINDLNEVVSILKAKLELDPDGKVYLKSHTARETFTDFV